MPYYIAVDGGGTKTESLLFDESGHILCRDLTNGSNGMDIGCSEVSRRICEAAVRIAVRAPEAVSSFFGGIAGVISLGDFLSESVRDCLPGAIVRIDDDGVNMISGEFGKADACGMVCGTGSALFIRKSGKLVEKLGGKGYLIDTGGSGFEIGRDAICMAFRSAERRCRHTVLEELVSEEMGKPVRESISDIYDPISGGRPFIASFAHTVFEGRKLGDWACEKIFEKASYLLADLTVAAEPYFDGDFQVVISGGIARNYPEYFEAVKAKASKRAEMFLGTVPPVYGAALEALRNLGVEETGDFKKRFLEEYSALQEKGKRK